MRKTAFGDALRRQIRDHLGSKLVFNAYIIMAMRLFASASGFVFWAAAARLMPASEVGLAAAVIAGSTLLAGVAQLGLGYGLVRHLPESNTPARLMNSVMAVVGGNGILLAVVFLAGLSFWSPALLPLRAAPDAIATFVLLTVGTGLTQLLNWHFLARRTPVYSLVKNTSQTASAIFILIMLALRSPTYLAAVHAYTISTWIGLLVAVIWFIPRTEAGYRFRVVLPRTIKTTFASYSLTNFAADQFNRLASTVMPLLVINVLGADQTAYFSIVWSLSAGLSSLDESVSASFFAESANEPHNTMAYVWKALKLTVSVSSIVSAGTLIVSRLILSVYGARYVEHAFWPLVIVTLSLVPFSLVPIVENFLRVRDQLGKLIFVSAADVGLGVLCTFLFMLQGGLVGAMVGWLISRFLLLGVIGLVLRRQVASLVRA